MRPPRWQPRGGACRARRYPVRFLVDPTGGSAAAYRKLTASWASSPQRRCRGIPGCPRSEAHQDDLVPAAAAHRGRPRARCATRTAGAMASEVATMQPTICKAEPAAWLLAPWPAPRSAAGLVELDVDGVVLADQRGQRGAAMHALVGADRHGARETVSASSRPAGSGCSIRVTPPARTPRGSSRDHPASSPRWRRRSALRVAPRAAPLISARRHRRRRA